MANIREVKINNCSIYFENLEQAIKPDSTQDAKLLSNDAVLTWSSEMLSNAVAPLVDVLDMLHRESNRMSPDEIELTMQLEVALNGETPVFKVVSLGSKYNISAKFVWKKEQNTNT